VIGHQRSPGDCRTSHETNVERLPTFRLNGYYAATHWKPGMLFVCRSVRVVGLQCKFSARAVAGKGRSINLFFRNNRDRPPRRTGKINRTLNSALSVPVDAFLSAFFESSSNNGFAVARKRTGALGTTKARYPGRTPEVFGRHQVTSTIGHEYYFRSCKLDETY